MEGHKIFGQKINPLLYVDGLKLFVNNDSEFEKFLSIVKEFSSDISMESRLGECVLFTFKAGKFHKDRKRKT